MLDLIMTGGLEVVKFIVENKDVLETGIKILGGLGAVAGFIWRASIWIEKRLEAIQLKTIATAREYLSSEMTGCKAYREQRNSNIDQELGEMKHRLEKLEDAQSGIVKNYIDRFASITNLIHDVELRLSREITDMKLEHTEQFQTIINLLQKNNDNK